MFFAPVCGPAARRRAALIPLRRLASLASGGALLLAACGPADSLSLSASRPELPSSSELRDVVIEGHRAAERDLLVRATRARLDLGERMARLDDVRIAFDEERAGSVHVQADEGEVGLGSDDFVLRGNVRGSTGGGERFSTDELRYDAPGERLWTRRPVRVERTHMTLESEGMEIDLESSRIRFYGGVQARSNGG
jgi:LPS export ABC transporter protein LptC